MISHITENATNTVFQVKKKVFFVAIIGNLTEKNRMWQFN